MDNTQTYKEFQQLLKEVAIEKAPDSFTCNVMQRIILDEVEAKSPFFSRSRVWIIFAITITLVYLFINQLQINETVFYNYFYFFIEDMQQLFVELFEFAGYRLNQLSGDILLVLVSKESLHQLFIFLIPILLLVFLQRLYTYFMLVKKTT